MTDVTHTNNTTTMQPLGRKPTRFPGKTDCHPRDGMKNWWEVEIGNDENKKSSRQAAKKAIATLHLEEVDR